MNYLITEEEKIAIIDLLNCVDCPERAEEIKLKQPVEEIFNGEFYLDDFIHTEKSEYVQFSNRLNEYNGKPVKILIGISK
jgi:hypothetical protein